MSFGHHKGGRVLKTSSQSNGPSKLQVLLCDGRLDLPRIISARSSLRFLGVFTADGLHRVESLISRVADRSLVVAGLERFHSMPLFEYVHLFPGALAQVSVGDLVRALQLAFSDHDARELGLPGDAVGHISLYMKLRPADEKLVSCCTAVANVLPQLKQISLHHYSLDDLVSIVFDATQGAVD